MMMLFDRPVNPKPASIRGKPVELSKEDIAMQIADQMLANPSAVGFQLSLADKGDYKLELLFSTEESTDRTSQVEKYMSIRDQIATANKSMEETDEATDEHAKAKATAEALSSKDCYSPTYILRYTRK